MIKYKLLIVILLIVVNKYRNNSHYNSLLNVQVGGSSTNYILLSSFLMFFSSIIGLIIYINSGSGSETETETETDTPDTDTPDTDTPDTETCMYAQLGDDGIYGKDCEGTESPQFQLLGNKVIQHISSNKCIHVYNGGNDEGRIVLHNSCGDFDKADDQAYDQDYDIIRYEQLSNNTIKHIKSRRFLECKNDEVGPCELVLKSLNPEVSKKRFKKLAQT